MNDVLREALEPVLRDVRASGAPVPRVADQDWAHDPGMATAMLWSRSGTGAGVSVLVHAPKAERLVWVADMVQEWVVEELWSTGASTNWPRCPDHPDHHPMRAVAVAGSAMWCCPSEAKPVAGVGAL